MYKQLRKYKGRIGDTRKYSNRETNTSVLRQILKCTVIEKSSAPFSLGGEPITNGISIRRIVLFFSQHFLYIDETFSLVHLNKRSLL